MFEIDTEIGHDVFDAIVELCHENPAIRRAMEIRLSRAVNARYLRKSAGNVGARATWNVQECRFEIKVDA